MTFWSEQGREDTLRKLAAEGYSASQIAAEVGTTRNSVISRAHRKGIKLGVSRVTKPMVERVERKVVNRNALGSSGPPHRTVALARVRSLEKPEPKAPIWSRPSASAPKAAPTPLRTPQPAPDGKPVDFLDRRIGQCCWPLWGAHERTGLVCGAATGVVTESYCAAHRRAASAQREAA